MERVPPTPGSKETAPAEMAPIEGAAKKPKARRPRKAIMTVAENAVLRLKDLFSEKEPRPAGIRLGVRTRGYDPQPSQSTSSLTAPFAA
jgi:hypothetical protein